MNNKLFKIVVVTALTLTVLFWLPFVILNLIGSSNTVSLIDDLFSSDAVIIFGTLVDESGTISPLMKQRLNAGVAILKANKAKNIVVSNTEFAANIMADYLIASGIDKNLIEIDTQAETTPDTCLYEKKSHPENRQLIFVSQSFHLPRLLYQCRQLSVTGVAFPAELLSTTDDPNYSLLTKLQVRSIRYTREAGLSWLVFLKIY